MDSTSNSIGIRTRQSSSLLQVTSQLISNSSANKIIYSPPASPAASINGDNSPAGNSNSNSSSGGSSSSPPASGVTSNSGLLASSSGGAGVAPNTNSQGSGAVNVATASVLGSPVVSHQVASMPCTPKKSIPDAYVLQRIREKLRTPGGACELHSLQLEHAGEEPVNVIKHRYLISTQPCPISAAAAAKTPASYRHLIDLTGSNLKCTDVFTEEQFLCKIINEPLHKVQRAYFQLQQEGEGSRSSIYGHALIRGVHDIVPLSKQRTYVIIAAPQPAAGVVCIEGGSSGVGVYEDLHTYIRNKRRLCETEARALFHQICETVQVCHRNGIILRDLKLKRFYFIDEARTKLQYESLEGSMILDDPNDDTLSDKIGCPLYTAPELLCPNPTYRGKPADMWSLGVILYTMLVGQYPFYEKGNCNLITIIRHGHLQIPMGLSKSVRWLLLLLLRKNHEERMQAEHIFLSPWLKEQRPYYMYIPVDVEISDDEDDGDDDEVKQSTLNADCSAAGSSSLSVDYDVSDDVFVPEPLDYSRSSLQLGTVTYETDGDVDMG